MKFTEEAMRVRLDEVVAEIATIKSVTDPMRKQRDLLVQQTSAQIAVLDAELQAAEAPLFDLQNERSMIAKALGGRSLSNQLA